MLTDFRSLPGTPAIAADLCIIGGGAAGIAIALALAGTRHSVCLVESGGLTAEADTQALYDGAITGGSGLPGLAFSRNRCLGGSTATWGGGCAPMLERDSLAMPGAPCTAWPILGEEMNRFYRQARSICMLDDTASFEDAAELAMANDPLSLPGSGFAYLAGISQPINFGHAHRARLERADNIQVLLHANLLELETDAGATEVRVARLGSLDGRSGAVRARHYILACGGIENARLLLLSDTTMPQGLGNAHGLVGRYFMDHPRARIGTLAAGQQAGRPGVPPLTERVVVRIGHIGLADEVRDAENLLKARFRLTYVEDLVPEGVQALRAFNHHLRSQAPAADTLGALLRAVRNIDDCGPAIARKVVGRAVVTESHIDCDAFFEQLPNPDSRVMLGTDRDRFGQRKVVLDWRFSEAEIHSYLAAARLFCAQIARAGHGPVALDPWMEDGADIRAALRGMCHHMGTTRMAADPREGVVDLDAKVHGIDNLHVAGSSVFTNGRGYWPTFTIVAQALRLAEHLRGRLGA